MSKFESNRLLQKKTDLMALLRFKIELVYVVHKLETNSCLNIACIQ